MKITKYLLVAVAAFALAACGEAEPEQMADTAHGDHTGHADHAERMDAAESMDAMQQGHAEVAHAAVADTLWTCQMNCIEPQQTAGNCPVCGMFLDANYVDSSGSDVTPENLVYTCPMHPEVVQSRPGRCPECNMYLVPTTQSEHGHGADEGGSMDMHDHGHDESMDGDAMDHSMNESSNTSDAGTATGEPITKYKCPMHPDFIRDEPGSCGICGMDLVEFTVNPGGSRSAVPGQAEVTLGEAQIQRIGARTEPARRMAVTHAIRTTGRIVPDERRVAHVHTKFDGWVERLYVDYTGQRVAAGDPVLDIYSPELVAAQEEYLVAHRSGRSALKDAARRRLELLDVTAAQIDRIERTGEPMTHYTIHAPRTGTVIGKYVSDGHRVSAASRLYTIADLSRVWVQADAYESDLPFVAEGQEASVAVPASGEILDGRVTFVSPVVDVHSRTAGFRVELPNPTGALRPGAFVDVSLGVPLGERLMVSAGSILDSGLRKVVFVEEEPGRFQPREVATGVRTDGMIEVVDGVRAGENVLASATFFIDSDSKLQAVIDEAVSGGGHQH